MIDNRKTLHLLFLCMVIAVVNGQGPSNTLGIGLAANFVAEKVAAEGLSLGASQALLLKKIEELTLYMIEMQRENEALKERVERMEEK